MGLQEVTEGVTSGCRGYKRGFRGVTKGYKGLYGVTRG